MGQETQAAKLQGQGGKVGKGQHFSHQIVRGLGGPDGLLKDSNRFGIGSHLATGRAQCQRSQTDHPLVVGGCQRQGGAGDFHTLGQPALHLQKIGLQRQRLCPQGLHDRRVRLQPGQGCLGLGQIGGDFTDLPAQQVHPGKVQIGAGAGVPPHRGQGIDPPLHTPGVAVIEQSPAVGLDQLDAGRKVSTGQAVFDGLGRLVVAGIPVARPPVQGGERFRLGALELVAQEFGEEVVIAIPAPLVVQGHQEEVGGQQIFQQGRAAALARDRIAQVAGQPGENRRLQQKGLDRGRLGIQHLFGQIAEDKAVAAAEILDESRRVGPALQRERCQLETGDPALRLFGQPGQVRRGEFDAHALPQKAPDLPFVKAQLCGPDFGELVAGAQAGQGQGRVLPGDQHQMQGGRLMGQQPLQDGEDGRLLNGLEIVEDTEKGGLKGCNVVDQMGDEHRRGWHLTRGQRASQFSAQGRVHPLQRGDEIGEEVAGAVVAGIQGEPGCGASRLGDPLRGQGALAVARGRGDEGHGPAPGQPVVQPLQQSRARHPIGGQGGQKKLLGEEGQGGHGRRVSLRVAGEAVLRGECRPVSGGSAPL